MPLRAGDPESAGGYLLTAARPPGDEAWAAAPDWKPSVVLVKDSVVAMVGNSLLSLSPDQ